MTRYTAGGGGIVPAGVNWNSGAPSSLITQVFSPLASDGTGTGGAMSAADFWENYYVRAQVSYNQGNANPAPPPASPCNGQQLASASALKDQSRSSRAPGSRSRAGGTLLEDSEKPNR